MERKKNTRQRGHRTHGWGAAKKHRGAGNRGGRGMAGSGKRADQKKPSIIKEYGNKYFGKTGFVKKNMNVFPFVNVNFLERNHGLFKKEGEVYSVDLMELGYRKLLGTGIVKKKFLVKVEFASKKAIEKIKKAGGDVVVNSSVEDSTQVP